MFVQYALELLMSAGRYDCVEIWRVLDVGDELPHLI
jgi:hypothetical protein